MYVRDTGFGTAAPSDSTMVDTRSSTLIKTQIPVEPPVVPSGMAGRVVDPSGVGVAGATVRAVSSGMSIRVTTDATGAFSLQCQPRTYVLLIHAEGIGDTQVGEIEGGAVVSGVVVVTGSFAQVGDIQVGTAVVDTTCPEGTVKDATGNCVSTGVDPCVDSANAWMVECGGTGVPPGVDPCVDSANAWMVECGGDGVAPDREKGEEPSPWYASPWVWIGAVVVVGGGIYLATRKR